MGSKLKQQQDQSHESLLHASCSQVGIVQPGFEELAEVFLTDQEAGEHLEPYFNGMPVLDISCEVIRGYVLHRFRQGADNDQVNSELLSMKRMFDRAMATVPPRSFHAPRIPVPDEVEAMRRAWLKSANNEGGW
ncbi:hypothetical protein AAU61_07340 [Desulfocarbo indianensis]|nr:hypothetical protein AAU61_07340 [Desulfocarbo indianensis]